MPEIKLEKYLARLADPSLRELEFEECLRRVYVLLQVPK